MAHVFSGSNSGQLSIFGVKYLGIPPLYRRPSWWGVAPLVVVGGAPLVARSLKSTTTATVVGGPKTFGKTKKLNCRRSLGNQTNLGDKQKIKKQKEDEN